MDNVTKSIMEDVKAYQKAVSYPCHTCLYISSLTNSLHSILDAYRKHYNENKATDILNTFSNYISSVGKDYKLKSCECFLFDRCEKQTRWCILVSYEQSMTCPLIYETFDSREDAVRVTENPLFKQLYSYYVVAPLCK